MTGGPGDFRLGGLVGTVQLGGLVPILKAEFRLRGVGQGQKGKGKREKSLLKGKRYSTVKSMGFGS